MGRALGEAKRGTSSGGGGGGGRAVLEKRVEFEKKEHQESPKKSPGAPRPRAAERRHAPFQEDVIEKKGEIAAGKYCRQVGKGGLICPFKKASSCRYPFGEGTIAW